MLHRILSGSRYLIVIAVLGTFLASATLIIYGGLTVLGIIIEVIQHRVFDMGEAKHLSVEVIEMIDQFLLGTVLYIISLGLYELFIDKDLPVPAWLVIKNLDDLKTNLVGVIIVLLAVTFLSYIVTWDGNFNILAVGIAVGLVLFALSSLFDFHKSPRPTHKNKDTASTEL